MKLGKYVGYTALGLLGVFGLRSCEIVPAGHVKVVDTFGHVSPNELHPGMNFVFPLSGRPTFDTRTKELKESMGVPTKDGLIVNLDVSVLYHVIPSKADTLYKTVGREYGKVIIEPNVRNVTRDVIAGYATDYLYSSNRKTVESDMSKILGEIFASRGIELERVLLRDLKLPDEVTGAIARKMSEKQESEKMQYTLSKENQEAERKFIEAQGIARAQREIAGSLTTQYLQWKHITTLEQLANSTNTTFVIAPYDQKLVPMLPLETKK